MELEGRIKLVGQTQAVSSSFSKRELVITTEENYPQHILVEFAQDKCSILDSYKVGELVKVGINLRGREWQSPQGEVKYFNSIQGWRIERVNAQLKQVQQQNNNYQQPQNNKQFNQQQQNFNQGQQQDFDPPF